MNVCEVCKKRYAVLNVPTGHNNKFHNNKYYKASMMCLACFKKDEYVQKEAFKK